MSKWTRFMDMYSGGGAKTAWRYIYIEAPLEESKVIFYNRFGRNPERVSCTCCGEDYSISEYPTLADASAYDRNCAFAAESDGYVEKPRYPDRPLVTVQEYSAQKEVLVIPAPDIKDAERKGEVPKQGYVWVD